MNSNVLVEEIKDQVVMRIIEESIHRINICLDLLTYEEVWHKNNADTNSIGNLILHLNGNVRQWLLNGVLGQTYKRNRDLEFSDQQQYNISELKVILQDLSMDVSRSMADLTYEQLVKVTTTQEIFIESGLSKIIHVIEHFSYHTGQIALLTKLFKNTDLLFYKDVT